MAAALVAVGSLVLGLPPASGPIEALPAVYTVTTPTGYQGAAFAIDDISLVTAAHVVEGVDVVRLEGTQTPPVTLQASVRYRNATDDVAVLQVSGIDRIPGPALTFSLPQPPPGTEVFAVGSPIDGVVLSKGVILRIEPDGAIVTSTPVDPGNSGGPLLDDSGHVLGVVIAQSDIGREAYTVPATVVQAALTAAVQQPTMPVEAQSFETGTAPALALAAVAVVVAVVALVIAVLALVLSLRRRRPQYPPLNITLE